MNLQRQSGKVLSLLTFLLALISVLGFAYLWLLDGMPMQVPNKQMLMQAVNQDKTGPTTAQSIETIEQSIAQMQNANKQTQQAIQTVQQQQTEQGVRLSAINSADTNQWKLAEAEYLVRLANHRLLMSKEVQGSLSLLVSAEEIINAIDDPSLLAVKEALANDVQNLKAVEQIDVQAAFAKLSALAMQVDRLPVFKVTKVNSDAPVAETETVSSDDKIVEQVNTAVVETPESFAEKIQTSTTKSANRLWNLLGINYHADFKATPMLTPEQHSLFIQNVRLLIEQAKVGLLSGQPEVYKNSLQEAYSLLELHGQKVANTDSMLETIAELQTLKVAQQLPDITASLKAILAFQKNKLSNALPIQSLMHQYAA